MLASSGDTPVLLTSKLKEINFTVSGVELPRATPRASTIDNKGWLRLVYTSPTRILRVAPDMGVHPAMYLPFQAHDIDIAGDRGFAYDGDDAYETADGGEKWAKVAGATSGAVKCVSTGCMQGGVVRVGWDLPSDSATMLASTATPAPKKKGESEEPGGEYYDEDEEYVPPWMAKPAMGPLAPPPPPLRVTCTPSGAWKPYDAALNSSPADLALDGDTRFLYPSWGKDSAMSVFVARGNAAPNM